MRYNAWATVLIGLSALCLTACSVSRKATSSLQLTAYGLQETRDTVREEVVVAVHDTLREVTTIIIQQNEAGDTVKQSVVTDRYRGRNAEAAKVDFPLRAVELNLHDERLTVQRDTVYIEKRDSSLRVSSLGVYGLREDGTPTVSGKLSAVSKVLKWIFWILIGLMGVIVTVKVCSLRR